MFPEAVDPQELQDLLEKMDQRAGTETLELAVFLELSVLKETLEHPVPLVLRDSEATLE